MLQWRPGMSQDRPTMLRTSRRGFLTGLALVAGGSSLTQPLLEASVPAGWQGVEADAAALLSAPVLYPARGATLVGTIWRPAGGEPAPGLILIPNDRGLVYPVQNVARRLAQEGFTVLAVDQLARQGGTASFPSVEDAVDAAAELSDELVVEDLHASFSYLQAHSAVLRDRIGVLGVGWGARQAYLFAESNPGLKVAVAFYGAAPSGEQLREIQCPVMAIYGEQDARTSAHMTETAGRMSQLDKVFEPRIIPGAKNGFLDDSGEQYSESVAQDGIRRATIFLRKYLE
jgi:carboxymethylenebutenolidase